MASFGSFAGLATAAVGALCSHEAQALDITDSCLQELERKRQMHKQPSCKPNSNGHSAPKFAPEFDGLDCFETFVSASSRK